MEPLTKLMLFAARNAFRNRRRAVATMMSISMSLFLISTLKTLLDKLESPSPMPNAARRAVIRNATSLGVSIPISYRDRIRRIDGIEAVAAAQWLGGVYRSPANFFAQYAVDADRLFDIYPETHADSEEQKDAFIHNRTAALAGTLLRARFGWKVGDRITLKGAALPVDVETTIVGFVSGGGNDGNFYLHWDYLNELFPENATQTFFIMAKDAGDLPAISETIDAMFANSSAPTKTEAESVFIVEVMSMWGNVRLFVLSISGAVLFTMILVASNTMAMSIRQRTAETAVLRTLGFAPAHVIGMMIAESSVICLGGGLLGSFGARCLYAGIDVKALTLGAIHSFEVSWHTVILSASISLAVAIFSTLIPACNAIRLPIAVAIRRNGEVLSS
ncbi:MAG TPA: FtsX-like permease family protein [Terriglobia bacterium]|nr:FtsX-like permease family protein [Terriglobia bacterium]